MTTDMRNALTLNFIKRVNKDCRVWAKDYFKESLIGLSVEKNKNRVSISSLDECNGDVDLNQRKGKLIAIYDVALKLGWQGQLSNGDKVFGTISVPEIAYDTDYDDYVFNINVNNGQDDIKKLIRTDLTPLLRDKFSCFTKDLIERHSSDLYATPSTPELKQRKPAMNNDQLINQNMPEEKVVNTSRMEHTYDFKGIFARDLYETLLDSKRADIWSQGRSKVSKKIGSQFSLFDGNIHGTLLQTTPYKTIVQSWRLKSWPKEHYSTVTLSLSEIEDGVCVKVNQIGVPVGQEETIRMNWMRYYWSSIKDCYSREQFKHLPIEDKKTVNFNYVYMILFISILLISFTAYQVAPILRF